MHRRNVAKNPDRRKKEGWPLRSFLRGENLEVSKIYTPDTVSSLQGTGNICPRCQSVHYSTWRKVANSKHEGWNFNSDNYLFTTDTK